MPRIKVHFALKDDDWARYQEKVEQFPEKVREATNKYMHGDARERMLKSIRNEMPISRNADGSIRDKSDYPNPLHAKKSEWYVSFNFEQAVTIENKLAGGKRSSFYYLFFPHEGTTRILKPNPFMERAVNKEYDHIVTDLFNLIDREIKEDL